MSREIFALKGTICYSTSPTELSITEGGYVVCENGHCAGVFPELPDRYRQIPCTDFGDELIIPGLTDLHIHAPQYTFRASGMDLELLDWLNTITFPQEARYEDTEFARAAYTIFAEDLKKGPNTRACIFGTLHVPATEILMELLNQTGLKTMVGKVNMDRNGSPVLQETSAQTSADATLSWLEDTLTKFKNVKPILTPRFIPSCSDELMEKLSALQQKYHLPVQSHLSENLGEIAWVQELCPDTHFYGEAYSRFGLFGGDCPTIMAHCVHSSDEEIALMKKQGVYVAHCPQSNTNLSSGIAPAARYLREGLHVGLGTDIAGGFSLSMLRAIADAIQVSKLRWRLVDPSLKALTLPEAFYMATIGGGSFFGKTGSFEKGYELDAVVLDDSSLPSPRSLPPLTRLERLISLSDSSNIIQKFVCGNSIFSNTEDR
mgnify:CR=1 FL=1